MNFVPIISSIMAGLGSTTPIRVAVKSLACMTVNMVSRLVEHRKAFAAKACDCVALVRVIKMNGIPIGKPTPVKITDNDSQTLTFKPLREVLRSSMR